ncbi:hypothetical protein KZC51_00555 [Microbacterium sp. SSW1-49]|uniref:Uncharacterized protein n=1 Tax=Microbacterium croceum TaxID=2851645 RepID=A0ABT0F988_9MICO|nr:hypothetical protein [Microbacterium croceum]MCK2034611.1 hypothetical protein [Microbacterium croceum]
MAELTMRADPDIWQTVPGPDEVAAWYERQVATAPEAAREAVATASALAIGARVDTDLSAVLLLCDPAAELYAMLGIAALDGVPAPASGEGAVGIAEALVPSPWPGESLSFDLDGVAGWRVTLLDEQGSLGDETIALPQTVSTVYVAEVRGRCVVAALSSLTPLAAAVAQGLAEQVVATFDVAEGDEHVG